MGTSHFNSRTAESHLPGCPSILHPGSKLVNGTDIPMTHHMNDDDDGSRGRNRDTKNMEHFVLLTLRKHFPWISLCHFHGNPVK